MNDGYFDGYYDGYDAGRADAELEREAWDRGRPEDRADWMMYVFIVGYVLFLAAVFHFSGGYR